MVVGTGGLIEQIVHPDKHPEWINDSTVTLKFKIVSDPRHLPLPKDDRVEGLGLGTRGVSDPEDTISTSQTRLVTLFGDMRRLCQIQRV